jgi:protein-disulfide isomerase
MLTVLRDGEDERKRRAMSKNLKVSLALVVVAFAGVLALANARGDSSPAESAATSRAERLVRPDSQRLSTAPDDSVTFVEFLDFECEACGAAYPAVEQLRERFGDRVTFVVRHFPLHGNSVAAARAAEAAGEQGEFEEMYQLLFERQTEWSHSSGSQRDTFFAYADELGLDMAQFGDDFEDPAIAERVSRDKVDGEVLGVTGTPTFFLNREKVGVSSFEELIEQIDAAVAA